MQVFLCRYKKNCTVNCAGQTDLEGKGSQTPLFRKSQKASNGKKQNRGGTGFDLWVVVAYGLKSRGQNRDIGMDD